MTRPPNLHLRLELEGSLAMYPECESAEEEQRLAAEVEARLAEIGDGLLRWCEGVREREGMRES